MLPEVQPYAHPTDRISRADLAHPGPARFVSLARQTFDAQEFMDGVREIEATGGRTFESLIAEVEAALT